MVSCKKELQFLIWFKFRGVRVISKVNRSHALFSVDLCTIMSTHYGLYTMITITIKKLPHSCKETHQQWSPNK